MSPRLRLCKSHQDQDAQGRPVVILGLQPPLIRTCPDQLLMSLLALSSRPCRGKLAHGPRPMHERSTQNESTAAVVTCSCDLFLPDRPKGQTTTQCGGKLLANTTLSTTTSTLKLARGKWLLFFRRSSVSRFRHHEVKRPDAETSWKQLEISLSGTAPHNADPVHLVLHLGPCSLFEGLRDFRVTEQHNLTQLTSTSLYERSLRLGRAWRLPRGSDTQAIHLQSLNPAQPHSSLQVCSGIQFACLSPMKTT